MIQGKIERMKDRVERKSQEFVDKWEDRSRKIIGGFLGLFGSENIVSLQEIIGIDVLNEYL